MDTFAITGPLTLYVRLLHGSVTVRASDDVTEATVALTPRPGAERFAERIAVDLRGQTLTVRAPRGFIGRRDPGAGTVDAEITVPTGTVLNVATDTADISLYGGSGTCDVASGAGAIRLDTVGGNLRVRCGSSSVEAHAVTGSVHLRAGSGEIRFGTVGGAMDTSSGFGRLEVDVLRGVLRAKRGSGTALLKAVYGDVHLLSGSGDTTIGLPAGVTARLDLTSGSGSITSTLPLDERQSGTGPVITVKARTGSGDITVVRAA